MSTAHISGESKTQRVGDAMKERVEQVAGKGEEVAERLAETGNEMKIRSREMGAQAGEYARRKPWVIFALVAVLGALVGYLWRR